MLMQTLFSLVLVACLGLLVAMTMILGWFYFHFLNHLWRVFFISFDITPEPCKATDSPPYANRFVVAPFVVAVATCKDGVWSLR